jgi:AraC family transcriptional regulator of adaptative response/methylated-DNA-[protein]-cysteine methyltransferase
MDSVVQKARTYLDERRGERVTLDELSQAVGASPFHLQRRFKEAFGVSPRDYQDAHRVEAVKSALKDGRRVTDALFDAGYGSVSRFYEKSASRLGMAATAYRAKGKGLAIRYSTFASPLGTILVAATDKGLCSVKIGDSAPALEGSLRREFSLASLQKDASSLKDLQEKVLAFLAGDTSLGRVPLDVRGTVFQQKVWDALRRIPAGETRTYREIARAIGAPEAVRAVGSACGANPVALAVPCHRAVRTDGGLGGYAWGLDRKRQLLQNEKTKGKKT